MKMTDWLKMQEARAMRRGTVGGLCAGIIVGIGLMLGIHIALSVYEDRIHESAVASMRQADALLYDECRMLVVDLAEAPYEDVVELKRSIIKTQGGVR